MAARLDARLEAKPIYPNQKFAAAQGVGFTSQRARDRMIAGLVSDGINDFEVLNAMRVMPRHLLVDEAMANRAYENSALPIGFGQTISQPYIVALMTAWARNGRKLGKVLDVGTGSGYQAAILALLADQVYSLERIPELQQRAKQVLTGLDLDNIEFALADGHWGMPAKAPFDAIVCAAAPEEVPAELLAQLAIGGRLVLPVGGSSQKLLGYEKTAQGFVETNLADVLFVPLKPGLANQE